MRRYFFHVKDGKTILDTDGFECTDVKQVRAEAIRTAGETLRELGPDFWRHSHWTMWVEDDSGATVLTLNFSSDLHGLDP